MANPTINTILERIYRFGIIKYYPKNKFIVKNDDSFQYIYLIIEGTAKVIPSSLDGVDSLIDILEPGDFIGDIEYYGETYYINSVQALEDCEVLMIPITRFNLLLDDREFSKFYIRNLTKKLYITTNKSKYVNSLSAKDRFLQFVKDESKNNKYTIPGTLEEFSKQLGISSRHLRRVMRELKQGRRILVMDKTIYIKEDR